LAAQLETAMHLPGPDGLVPAPNRTRRGAIASMFFSGYAIAALDAGAAPIVTDDQFIKIEEGTIKSPADGFALPYYLARPAKRGRYPAVVVVNEIFGIHAYIKDICRRLANAGYVALAPDYFRRKGDPSTMSDFKQIMPIVQATPNAQVLADTQGAVDFLMKRRRQVTAGGVGITGFCWGGAVTWNAAALVKGVRAGVAWYGRLAPPKDDPARAAAGAPWPVETAAELKAPVLGLYAEKDQGIPLDTVEAMRAALAGAGNPTKSEIIVYPDAQHGFHADYRASYKADDAIDGWARMLAWFAKNGLA
jgi:carboxymethylenebutenolidase